MKIRAAWVAGAIALTSFSPATATIVSSLDDGVAVDIPVIAGDEPTGMKGPISFGPGITATSTSGNSLFGYTGDYGFAPDSLWSGTSMIGLNVGRGTVTLTFATPLSGFLAEISSTEYASSSDAIISAFDASGNLLDHIVMERNGYQVQPGFMGFSYDTAEISRITFANEYIGFRNISIVQADPTGAVPEPATWGMMIVGLGLTGTALRRARRPRRQTG